MGAAGEETEKRIALLIGNAAYESAPLRNPVNDVRTMSTTLKSLGFEVTALENASQTAMKQAIDEFGESLQNAGKNTVGLFYYSGHGMQVRGRNFIIPVGAKIKNERQVEYESVDVSRALAAMEEAGNSLNIVILDACRDNPFSRSMRTGATGLALMDAASGTLIGYATAPGRTADDGARSNGLYTEQLVRHMKTPGLKVEEVFKRVRNDVEALSNRTQVPWESSSLKGDFYFAGRQQVAGAAGAPLPGRALDEEEVLWMAIEGSSNAQDFEDYLQQFPRGRFATTARIKSRQLKGMPQIADSPNAVFLSLTSQPPGASVFINDQLMGQTPIEMKNLGPQRAVIEMRLAGYRTWKEDILLRAGQRLSFNESLQEYRMASVDTRSLKPDAEVLLNGVVKGTGGKTIEDIEPGFYGIEVREPGLRPWKDIVNLQPGEPWKLLVPVSRKFNIGVFPGQMSGDYMNSVDRRYGTRTGAEWALLGLSEGLARMPQFEVTFSHYDGFPVAKTTKKDIKDQTWKGLIFVEINTTFLRRKAMELDLDAVLLPSVKFSAGSGPFNVYVYDVYNNRVLETSGIWKDGKMTGDIAGATADVLHKFLTTAQ